MFNLNRISAQTAFDLALKHWENGDFKLVEELATNFLENNPRHDKAKYLLMRALYVQGQYTNSINIFSDIRKTFLKYKRCAYLAAEAYVHLGKYDDELDLAENHSLFPIELIGQWRLKPFRSQGDSTHIVPFTTDLFEFNSYKFSSEFWPGIKGSINGIDCDLRLDTGGDYLMMGKAAAHKLDLKAFYKTKSLHNLTKVNTWYAVVNRMNFKGGPEFINVPVTIYETLGEAVIIGTNILEQFLTTVDYPNKRFIFTPRSSSQLKSAHYAMLTSNQSKLSFYLWSDHYMISKGKLANFENINLFFDSGLMYITEKDGKEFQASLFVAKENLLKWGFDKNELAQSNFLFTEYTLEVAGFSQSDMIVWYDRNLKKNRTLGGIRIDGLVSHAWLKNYSWTIDFDKMEYTFGLPE